MVVSYALQYFLINSSVQCKIVFCTGKLPGNKHKKGTFLEYPPKNGLEPFPTASTRSVNTTCGSAEALVFVLLALV